MAGGVEIAYAEITSTFTTTSTSLVDVTGLTVTITRSAGSRPIVVKFGCAAANCTAASTGGVYLNDNGTDLGNLCGGGSVYAPWFGARRLSPSTGQHIYKLRAKNVSAGTLTLIAGAGTSATVNMPAFIQVIEI